MRIPATGFLEGGSAPLAVEHSPSFNLNLAPSWYQATTSRASSLPTSWPSPLQGRAATEGALLPDLR